LFYVGIAFLACYFLLSRASSSRNNPAVTSVSSFPDKEKNLFSKFANDDSTAVVASQQQPRNWDICSGKGAAAIKGSKEAYATVVFEPLEGFMKAAEVLAHSLKLTNTSRPIVAIITRTVNSAMRRRLQRAGYILHDVEMLAHPIKKCENTRWTGHDNNSEIVKLRVWELDCLDKVVYLDADMLVIKNIDWLFTRPGHPVSAVRGISPRWGFNAGLMVLKPSKKVFNDMMSKFVSIGSYDCGDQGFLNMYFKWRDLSDQYKLPDHFNSHHRVFNQMSREAKLQTSVLHYSSLKKPWRKYTEKDPGVKLWWDHLEHMYDGRIKAIRWNKQRLRHRIISELQEWIREIILPLVPPGAPVALIDYPDHRNVGDQAIWLGEQILFREAKIRIVFECSAYVRAKFRYQNHDCNFNQMRELLGKDGVIFMHGGGNFRNFPGKNKMGFYQNFRQQTMKAFPDNRIVFLPQTINFEKKYPDVLTTTIEQMKFHNNLTMLFRDTYSLAFARKHFPQHKSILCPDMAFLIGLVGHNGLTSQRLFRPGPFSPPQYKMLWIGRLDSERSLDKKSVRKLDPSLGFKTDWKNVSNSPDLTNMKFEKMPYTERAAELVSRGLELLNRGQVVVTDRLHGMILGLLLGKTIVAMDNNYGKVSKYYNTFLFHDPNIFWATDEPEAMMMAKMLAEAMKRDPGVLKRPRLFV